MAFFDKLKEAKDAALSAANSAAEKAKTAYNQSKEEYEKKKAEEAAYLAEMQGKVNAYVQEITAAITEYDKGNKDGFFSKNSQADIEKYTKEFFEKILLPANSVSTSIIKMYPFISEKEIKKIEKSFNLSSNLENILVHIKDKNSQEFIITYDCLYFKMLFPEDNKFFAIGKIPMTDISMLSLEKANDHYNFICDTKVLASLPIINNKEEDYITLNRYFSDIKNQDFVITNEEIDKIIQEKIGSKIYQQIKKYMIYDDELAIYFAWGLDSYAAKDYIVCTNKQIIIMDREAFGATANVKQIYYEDITSAQTIQNTGDTSLTGMLIDAALASVFQQCDLEITVAGSVTRINTLCKVEAERVIAIYHEHRKMMKQAASQPQQVIVQQSSGPDVLEQLEKLSKLKEAGIISEDEFNTKKADLLAKL